MTTHTTPTTDTTPPPATKGRRRGQDIIEVAIPDGRDTSTSGNPIHVDANLLYDAIEVLQIAVVTLDPFKDDAPAPAAWYRLRVAMRRITTRLEEAVLADWPTDDGEPCRAFIAELAGHEEPQP